MMMLKAHIILCVLDKIMIESFFHYLFSTHQNFFNPKYYLNNEEVCITMLHQWLKKLILRIGSIAIESNTSGVELFEFAEIFRHECENKSLLRHDSFVGASTSGIPKWHTS